MDGGSDQEKKAVEGFHNPYSCAQAVFAAFSEKPSTETMAQLKANSAGRAPGGMCGALYAAHILTDESKHAALDEYFTKYAGGTECKYIKKETKTSCAQCVIHAVRALISVK